MKQKPKILILVDWFWPGYKAGGPIQSVMNLVAWLGEEVEFSILTSNKDYLTPTAYSQVPSDQWTTVLNGIRVFYASEKNMKMGAIRKLLLAEQYDYLVMNSMFSLPFTIFPLWILRKKGIEKVILAPRGMLAQGALSIKSKKKTVFLKLFSFFKFHRKVTFWATSDHEREDIIVQFGEGLRIKTAPNLPARKQPALEEIVKTPGHLKLVSISRISPEKNNKMIFKVLQGVKADVEVDLYGPVSNEEYWAACQQAIRNLPPNVRVEYHGQVTREAVQDVVRNAHFFILATLGENFGHAIFESLSLGRPVIISDTTPWRNLTPRKAGFDLPLLDKAAFIKAIEQAAAMDQRTFDTWSQAAYGTAQSFMQDGDLKKGNLGLFEG